MKHISNLTRRTMVRMIAGTVAGAFTAALSMPVMAASTVTINVVDVAGSLALLQEAIESYKVNNPNVKFTFTKAPAPELPSKLKAMQAANRSDIDLVLGGTDILAAGIDQKLWVKILPDNAAKFPNLAANYLPPVNKMQELAQDQALAVAFMPAGPLLEYNPDKVKQVPTTPQELLAYCKANPNRLIYARPSNSGPGRTFLMGLPYLLGDKDPKDPVNGWSKTWAYLKELNSCIEYYPGGTGAVMKELGEGSRDMTVTVTGWDINPRALGVVPKNFKVGAFKNMTWINDTHYMMMPKGLSAEKSKIVLDVMAYLLKPAQQAMTYDKGYFYPGPAIKNVPLSMAPKSSQDVIKEFGRPEYDALIANNPHAQPLDAQEMVKAFHIWDEQIGTQKSK
ncbi:putative spermidine/putrescine transport system substrate-binding protein [Collimonas sp. OK607]|uniref:extracellular solute-binding protein n=1 Tax=Collimonas sp. OK607 TaxID=1798194 RepID=UPI0008E6F171|nr:extracellular solute-binding protein [Collimonas sp. OK607]SFB06303.1 putative spermidine/putrescine transport system substrate-binding protein [Collimonas sp. OK607]